MNRSCYSCLKPLDRSLTKDLLHSHCYKKLFAGRKVSLRLKYDRKDLLEEARQRATSMSLAGAQPKVAIAIMKGELHVVSEGGEFLLKPSNEKHPYISENEHLCMNIAATSKLTVPPFCLVELADGELAYLIKRFDRNKGNKIHLEDMASVLSYPADRKYQGSYLAIGKAIQRYCRDKGLDTSIFMRVVMLSFLIGNNDLHLKNLSILDYQTHYALSPIYDLVCAMTYYPQAGEMALELMPEYEGQLATRGFYSADDFIKLGAELGIEFSVSHYLAQSLVKDKIEIQALVQCSFLPDDEKKKVAAIINEQNKKFCSAM